MHPYLLVPSTVNKVYLACFALAVPCAWILQLLVSGVPFSTWWIEAPSVFGFYILWFKLADKYAWKYRRLHWLFKTPNLAGKYTASLRSSFDGRETDHDVEMVIVQSYTHMRIRLGAAKSGSVSGFAVLDVGPENESTLSYWYRNDPKNDAHADMHSHDGSCTLRFSDADAGQVEGEYYSGRDRENYGTIRFNR